jgi:hypothetical protein
VALTQEQRDLLKKVNFIRQTANDAGRAVRTSNWDEVVLCCDDFDGTSAQIREAIESNIQPPT